jgi:hypothetical protein
MERFRSYVIQPIVDKNPKHYEPFKKWGGPAYIQGSLGGAWPIAENIALSAECQAIVRFVGALLRQLGVPGTAQARFVYADPAVSGGKVALYDRREGDEQLTTNDNKKKQSGTRGLGLDDPLYDRRVERPWVDGSKKMVFEHLRLFPDAQLVALKGAAKPNFDAYHPNTYEACLHFEHDGEAWYYAGGMGDRMKTPQEVLESAFKWLAWAYSAIGDEYFGVWEVVAKYR